MPKVYPDTVRPDAHTISPNSQNHQFLSHELSEFRMEAQKLYLGIRAEEDGQTEYEDMMID